MEEEEVIRLQVRKRDAEVIVGYYDEEVDDGKGDEVFREEMKFDSMGSGSSGRR